VLNVIERGDGNPVVLVHGFTQSASAWWPLVEPLESTHRIVALDAPGHGGSSGVEAGLADGSDLMVATSPAPAAWVGYSMGSRFALHAALRHPSAVERLVLVSATAGIDDAGERTARRSSDAALAERVETDGVETFLQFWVSQPMFSTLPPEAARLEERIASSNASGLASSLRLAGAGSQAPAWELLPSLAMPVLVVAGALDEKYRALGRRIADSIGSNAEMRVIPGAGHACHLERPDEFLEVLAAFLKRR